MNSVVFGILAFLFVGERVSSAKIEFFRNWKLTGNKLTFYEAGLVCESNSTAKCTNIPADKQGFPITSFKTDTCIMVYEFSNCEGFSRKFTSNNKLVFPFLICDNG